MSRVRRLITIVKYTEEPKKLLNQAVDSYIKDGTLKAEKRKIPLGKFFSYKFSAFY